MRTIQRPDDLGWTHFQVGLRQQTRFYKGQDFWSSMMGNFAKNTKRELDHLGRASNPSIAAPSESSVLA